MTKQDEIREGVAERIYKWYFRNSQLNDLGEWDKASGATHGIVLAITDIVLEYEASQGVVIKVDRELPKPNLSTVSLYCFREGEAWVRPDVRAKRAIEKYGQDILKAGYESVKPLIKEEG